MLYVGRSPLGVLLWKRVWHIHELARKPRPQHVDRRSKSLLCLGSAQISCACTVFQFFQWLCNITSLYRRLAWKNYFACSSYTLSYTGTVPWDCLTSHNSKREQWCQSKAEGSNGAEKKMPWWWEPANLHKTREHFDCKFQRYHTLFRKRKIEERLSILCSACLCEWFGCQNDGDRFPLKYFISLYTCVICYNI